MAFIVVSVKSCDPMCNITPAELPIILDSYNTTHFLNKHNEWENKCNCRYGEDCKSKDDFHNLRYNHPQPQLECKNTHCNNITIQHVRGFTHKNAAEGSFFYKGDLLSSSQNESNKNDTPVLTSCKFEHMCGDFAQEHRTKFSHPEQSPCRHGKICRDFNEIHCKKFSHPRRTECKFGKECKHYLGKEPNKEHMAEFVHPKLDCKHGNKCWDQTPEHCDRFDHPWRKN